MSAACAGKFWLWGWLDAVRGFFFRKRERRRKVSITVRLGGSVKRRIVHGFEVTATVLRNVEKTIALVGSDFRGIVLDLLMEDDD